MVTCDKKSRQKEVLCDIFRMFKTKISSGMSTLVMKHDFSTTCKLSVIIVSKNLTINPIFKKFVHQSHKCRNCLTSKEWFKENLTLTIRL